MKVHPTPNPHTITPHYNFPSQPPTTTTTGRQKNLRRLPHIFAKVLELPFYADADVAVQDSPASLRFVVETDDDIGTDIAARMVEIYPGVIKIVVGGNNGGGLGNEMEVDVWRFRLPECTVPEMATAVFRDGELVVVVPKDGDVVGV